MQFRGSFRLLTPINIREQPRHDFALLIVDEVGISGCDGRGGVAHEALSRDEIAS